MGRIGKSRAGERSQEPNDEELQAILRNLDFIQEAGGVAEGILDRSL